MDHPELLRRSAATDRARDAERLLADAFEEAGWQVRSMESAGGRPRPDLLIARGHVRYAVELKVASEGRSDRLIPLWSQAYLQALRVSDAKHPPLVVVAAPVVPPRIADQILRFAAEHAPNAAAGVIDLAGLRRFRGDHLDGLDSPDESHGRAARPTSTVNADIFSDLNQWMLKVLLAPEISPKYLSAPRERYRDASHLAKSAGVSVMSASRLVRQLQQEGYLDDYKRSLRLVRRKELFRRWRAVADRPVSELRMRFRLGSDPRLELRKVMKQSQACLALFAAADALELGFVRGVPPYLYVPKLKHVEHAGWKNLSPVVPGEPYSVILRQPHAVRSVFRAAVRVDEDAVSDVIQIWLDVSSHPSRGEEQADRIYRKVLAPVIEA